MPSEGFPLFSPRDTQDQFEPADFRRGRLAGLVSRMDQWEWLHELRNRFELAIEVVDFDLELVTSPVPHVASSAALRAALERSGDGTLRETAAAVMRSPKARSVTIGGLRVRLFPLLVRVRWPPMPVLVLMIADTHPHDDESGLGAAEIDHRLDAAGHWLVAAIEAAIAASAQDMDQVRGHERLAGIVDLIDVVSRGKRDMEIMALVLDAIALWYDADVRVYRQDFCGAFVLETCLPAVDPAAVARRLDAVPIMSRHDVFRLESILDLQAIGWDGSPETTFVPFVIDDTTEWLVTVSGSPDPSLALTLGLLSRMVSIRLTHLLRDAIDRLRGRLRSLLTFGDAPFDATVRLALEVIARETGALRSQVAVYYDPAQPPALRFGWAAGEDDMPPFVEAGTTTATNHAISVGIGAGSGATAVLALRAEGCTFPAGSVRLAQSAAELLGVLLSGAMVRPHDVRAVGESEYSTEFVGRLGGYVDPHGRLRTGGVVAVVLPDVTEFSGVQLDEVIQVVQEHVRSSDVVGIVGTGAGVLIPEASRAAASALVERLSKAACRPGCPPVRVGVIAFPPLSESPDTLVRRALTNAQRWMAS
jgi:hypothetical protein